LKEWIGIEINPEYVANLIERIERSERGHIKVERQMGNLIERIERPFLMKFIKLFLSGNLIERIERPGAFV